MEEELPPTPTGSGEANPVEITVTDSEGNPVDRDTN